MGWLTDWKDESYISFTPVLSWLSGGNLMTMSPRAGAAYLYKRFFQPPDQHPENCDCKCCTERREKEITRAFLKCDADVCFLDDGSTRHVLTHDEALALVNAKSRLGMTEPEQLAIIQEVFSTFEIADGPPLSDVS